ncbi:Peptidase C56, PfpI [Halomicronema hongdechloris C2206]|uniref:Peptidase C56, PfpI n=1 Tax=Halomicronema hongdechloris C2206 TaxID=1641165 RepID=A0A1Z3HJL5_9CYAN|nr:DJ-1/PfpI/YhbO family deglycase/protease [Halomicronema hongdechloris]ASC70475.1 Peptidase C56, PfpI [Halomicronema hongdechloris C2206]
MTYATPSETTPKRIAILIESGFEDSEFTVPYTALKRTDAKIVLVGSRMNEEYTGKKGKVTVSPDATATEVLSDDFDAVLIPGGHAPDKIRRNDRAVRLVMDAMAQGKVVAAICHAPHVLVEADQLRDRRATGFHSVRKDMQNAGATYVDEPVVVDGPLITSRRPGDLPLFTTVLLSQLGLAIEGEALPDLDDQEYDWWKLAESWGGSNRQDILNVINTALVGERYTQAAFRQYLGKVSDAEAKTVFTEVITAKETHIEQLEMRLRAFGEEVSWQAIGSEALATLQNWIQSSDEVEILRRALGDLQTGALDAAKFSGQLTDPVTSDLLDRIAQTLTRLEARVGDLYRARLGSEVEPPLPTTAALG